MRRKSRAGFQLFIYLLTVGISFLCSNFANVLSEFSFLVSGVGVRLKVGGINIEKSEGVRGSGEGLCPPQFGVWGLAHRKTINFALKKFWYTSLLYYSINWGGGDYPQS